jgi:hypothetical protein
MRRMRPPSPLTLMIKYKQDCTIEVEPSDVDRPWCLRIIERRASGNGSNGGSFSSAAALDPATAAPAGPRGPSPPRGRGSADGDASPLNELLLVSADSAAALLQWANAFERAGVKVAWPVKVASTRAPSPAPSFSSFSSRTFSAPLLGNLVAAATATATAAATAAAAAAPSGAGRPDLTPSPSGRQRRRKKHVSFSSLAQFDDDAGPPSPPAQQQQQPSPSLFRQLSTSFALPPLLVRSVSAIWGDADAAAPQSPLTGSPLASSSAPAPGGGGSGRLSSNLGADLAGSGGLGSPGRSARQFSRLPSQRWVREPSREEFVAFDPSSPGSSHLGAASSLGLHALGIASDGGGAAASKSVPRKRSSNLGRSTSASAILWPQVDDSSPLTAQQPADVSPFANCPLRRTEADGAAAGGVAGGVTAAAAGATGTPPRPPVAPRTEAAKAATAAAPMAAAAVHAPAAQPVTPQPARVRRVMWGSTAVHVSTTDSLLTSRATYLEQHSGLVTLALVVLATTHLR